MSLKKLALSLPIAARFLRTSAALGVRKIVEKAEGSTTIVEGVIEDSARKAKLLHVDDPHGSCPLCRLNLKVTFRDVLILRQFMRSDGSVISKKISGLCAKQQKQVELSVIQAHWAGLFPNLTPEGRYEAGLEGVQTLNRTFDRPGHMNKFSLEQRPGSFYVVRRYH